MKKENPADLKDDLSNYDADKYKKPSVAVDICICRIIEDDLKVLLIKRKYPPFRNCWALPGGFLEVDAKETLSETAARELHEETGLKDIYLEQLATFGDPDRDPRMRILSVAHFALIPYDAPFEEREVQAGDDAAEAQWFPLRNLTIKLAFDHEKILDVLAKRLRGKILYSDIAFQLVPKNFTWTELQQVYELILGQPLIPANFRRKIRSQFLIAQVNQKKQTGGRSAQVMRFCGEQSIL